MRILMTGRNSEYNGQDYLFDTILHGLRSLFGNNVIDSPKIENLYEVENEANKTKLYGRGFTIWHTLKNLDIDRNQIEEKIKDLYFDIIFIGGTWHRPSHYLKLILDIYPKNKIVFLDGRDHPAVVPIYLIDKGYYFQTELTHDIDNVYPISYSFPEEKIQSKKPKIRKDSIVQPSKNRHGSTTYIYYNEDDYYNDYAQSLFGYTIRRGQWETLRHYEIMGCRCIPYFPQIEESPERVLTFIPKNLFKDAVNIYKESFDWFQSGSGESAYNQLEEQIYNHFKEHLTTKAMARHILNFISK